MRYDFAGSFAEPFFKSDYGMGNGIVQLVMGTKKMGYRFNGQAFTVIPAFGARLSFGTGAFQGK